MTVQVEESAEQRAEAAKRRQHFSYFYSGWSAYMEGRPKYPQGTWGIVPLRWYTRGWLKAEKAAKEFKGG